MRALGGGGKVSGIYRSLVKERPPPTFALISCIGSSLLELTPTLERASRG